MARKDHRLGGIFLCSWQFYPPCTITYYIELQFLTAVSGRKRCEVHVCTSFVLLLLLSVFHSFSSSPFFRFMEFFCFCSRQGIAIPYYYHAVFSVYVAMLQYNRICDVATRYRSVTINSFPPATLTEIWIFVFTFFLLHSGFFNLSFIPSEVFFRQIAFVGVETVVPHDAEITQGHVLQQPGKNSR